MTMNVFEIDILDNTKLESIIQPTYVYLVICIYPPSLSRILTKKRDISIWEVYTYLEF